jgi:hypothetical protein
MPKVPSAKSVEISSIKDHVLLLFNEHDTRIALNWEVYAADRDRRDAIIIDLATSQSSFDY